MGHQTWEDSLSPQARLSAASWGSRGGTQTLHSLFQFLRRPEGDLLAGLDLDRLTGRRVPTHSCRALPHLEDAQTGQTDFVALLEVLRGERHQVAQHGLSLLLREVMAVCQLGGQMLQRDGSLRGSIHWGCLRWNGGLLGCGGSFLR